MPGIEDSSASSLIALFLVIRTRSGPRFIFHYPPVPSLDPDEATSSSNANRRKQKPSTQQHGGTSGRASDGDYLGDSDEYIYDSDQNGGDNYDDDHDDEEDDRELRSRPSMTSTSTTTPSISEVEDGDIMSSTDADMSAVQTSSVRQRRAVNRHRTDTNRSGWSNRSYQSLNSNSRHRGTISSGSRTLGADDRPDVTKRLKRSLREEGPDDSLDESDSEDDRELVGLGKGGYDGQNHGQSKLTSQDDRNASRSTSVTYPSQRYNSGTYSRHDSDQYYNRDGRLNVSSDQEQSNNGNGDPTSPDNMEGSSSTNADTILGYTTEGLEKLLSPGRDLRKKRFEVMLGDVVFLGYPIFAREEGLWRKKKRGSKPGTSGSAVGSSRPDRAKSTSPHRSGALDIGGTSHNHNSSDMHEPVANSNSLQAGNGSFQSHSGLSEANSEAKSGSSASDSNSNEMIMYHVVFVMTSELPLKHHARITEMYENVAKKFAKALKFEQARTGYVWEESKKILDLKQRGKENGTPLALLWPTIMQASPLARSLAHIYAAITTSKIAHVTIGRTVDASMQLPQLVSVSNAPTPANPQTPGLWLTTATMREADGSISPHTALLLLEDKSTLLKEIEGDNRELAGPLSYFVRELSPTKSLQKTATRLSLRLSDLQFLARHLIYWRRARAIPPLHLRDIYIISPLADMRKFRDASIAFTKKFPKAPDLARMFQSLSCKPLPFGYHIPSQEQKQMYMEILAWLLRGNWITQLRTFAWIRVPVEIKVQAAALTRKEEAFQIHRKTKQGNNRERPILEYKSHPSSDGTDSETDPKRTGRARNESLVADLISPLIRPAYQGRTSETDSVSSTKTAVLMNSEIGPSASELLSKLSVKTDARDEHKYVPNESDSEGLTDPRTSPNPAAYEPSLILSPQKASAEEMLWLTLIKRKLGDEELQKTWSALCDYFDGRWALEEIAARQSMKRSRVANFVARLEREGVLCIARHW